MSKTISIPRGEKNTPVETKRTVGTTEPHPLSGCHVGGVLVEALPAHRLVGLFWKQTDEGMAAANAGKTPIKVRVVAGELEHAIERKRDFMLQESEPWLAPDPMRALADEHVVRGMHPRFLSQARLNKEGNYTRGYEVVRGENGDPIKLGTLVLSQMPQDMADKKNAHYEGKGNQAMKEILDSAKEKSDGMLRTARQLGIEMPAGEAYAGEA